ncbi:MAG: hypothetical protein AAF666_12615 [Pseudomonadota bacterium]
MAKSNSSRIDDTIKFIRTTAAADTISDAHRSVLADELINWKLHLSPGQIDTIGGFLAQGNAGHRAGTRRDRNYVRASILLNCAFILQSAAWAGFATGQKAVPGNYENLYKWALAPARDRVMTKSNRIVRVLGDLVADPVGFLREQQVTIRCAGDANPENAAESIGTFTPYFEDGTLKFADRRPPDYATVTMSAIGVYTTDYGTQVRSADGGVNAITGVDTSLGADCGFLFTTQFTGCGFCFERTGDGSRMLCAHVDPGGRGSAYSAQDVRAAMVGVDGGAGGSFSNSIGADFNCYGKVPVGTSDITSPDFGYPQNCGQMTIIGIRDGVQWKLYAQVLHNDLTTLTAARIDG